MSKIYVISDLHFGHEKLAKHRGFKDATEMAYVIIRNWNRTITKRDTVWVLGDITMEKANYDILDELNGTINVVAGNHDKPQHIRELLKHVNKVCSSVRLKMCILTHIPIHPQEIRKLKYNIHGHIHEHKIKWWTWRRRKYINVSCEAVNYTPVLLDDLIK